MSDTAGSPQRINAAERRAKVVALRRQRLSFEAIGQELGVTRQRAWTIYQDAVASVPVADVELHRLEMLEQLDEAERAVLAVLHANHIVVSNGHVVSEIVGHHPLFTDEGEAHPQAGEPIYGEPLTDHGPVLDAARTLVAIQARKAKLVGADAAVKTELNQTITSYQVDLGDGDAAKAALT
jgi:hypothetical protein